MIVHLNTPRSREHSDREGWPGADNSCSWWHGPTLCHQAPLKSSWALEWPRVLIPSLYRCEYGGFWVRNDLANLQKQGDVKTGLVKTPHGVTWLNMGPTKTTGNGDKLLSIQWARLQNPTRSEFTGFWQCLLVSRPRLHSSLGSNDTTLELCTGPCCPTVQCQCALPAAPTRMQHDAASHCFAFLLL